MSHSGKKLFPSFKVCGKQLRIALNKSSISSSSPFPINCENKIYKTSNIANDDLESSYQDAATPSKHPDFSSTTNKHLLTSYKSRNAAFTNLSATEVNPCVGNGRANAFILSSYLEQRGSLKVKFAKSSAVKRKAEYCATHSKGLMWKSSSMIALGRDNRAFRNQKPSLKQRLSLLSSFEKVFALKISKKRNNRRKIELLPSISKLHIIPKKEFIKRKKRLVISKQELLDTKSINVESFGKANFKIQITIKRK